MKQSANPPEIHRYATQLVLALTFLLALNTNIFAFQTDKKSPEQAAPAKQNKDDDDQKDDATEDKDDDLLRIGEPAPALELDSWPTDNNGLLPAIKKFAPGTIYVVNFFSIENEYSVGKLKSMVKLQKKYTDDPVQVICISTGDREETEEFLEKKVDSGDDETYFDLLNPISSAIDSKRKTTMSYMARTGFLTSWTFIVGKTGKLEWLGPPTDVAEPLAKIVKGKWDRKAFAKEIEPKQNRQTRKLKANQQFAKWMVEESKGKRWDAEGLLGMLAKGAKDSDNKDFLDRIEYTRMSIMLRAIAGQADIENLETDLVESMESFTKLSQDDTNSELNDFAWEVYELYEAGGVEKRSKLMKTAKVMAEKALKFRPKSGAVNDTVAHFAYLIDGDLDRAIELQELAIENAGDTQADELEDFLKFLKKEQSTGKKKSLQKKDDDEADDSDF